MRRLFLILYFCSVGFTQLQTFGSSVCNQNKYEMNNIDTITFGAGCFWCVETIFQNLKGVQTVVSGYSGGEVINPAYREVCEGTTGHAEVCMITYDTTVISLVELLEVFWRIHDPTTLNRQGADMGTQYRSVIFYSNETQKETAEEYKIKLDESDVWNNPIVTEISPSVNFYPAENKHQNYYNLHRNEGYCRMVIAPKIDKFKKVFSEKLK